MFVGQPVNELALTRGGPRRKLHASDLRAFTVSRAAVHR